MQTVTGTGRRVRINTVTVGQNYGTVGVVKALNGRIIHQTVPVFLGADSVARRLAIRWCESR